jgi:hypothetical protein
MMTMESIASSPEYWEIATENDESLRKSLFTADATTFHSSVFITIQYCQIA